jgi:GNAT superfamily N-acetyltransferase
MAELTEYDPAQHAAALERLLTAYLEEGLVSLRAAGLDEVDEVPTIVADDLARPDRFRPPHGARLLVDDAGAFVGCGALRVIAPGVAEIKRMYLDPSTRGRGLGRLLIEGLLAEARRLGCHEARLDTGWFMTDAQRLYRAAGFVECAPYAESEIPADFDARWVYMRRDLTTDPGAKTPVSRQSARK